MTDAQKKKVVTLEGLKEYHDELSTKTLSGMSVGYASNAGKVNNKTVATNVPSGAVFTDGNVTQTATSGSADYEVLFSGTADNITRTEGARKNSNLKFNPSTGNLQVTKINGVAVGSSPKFTDSAVIKDYEILSGMTLMPGEEGVIAIDIDDNGKMDIYTGDIFLYVPFHYLSEITITQNATWSDDLSSLKNGDSNTIIYRNNTANNLIVTVQKTSTILTPTGSDLQILCPAGGFCEVNCLKGNNVYYVRGI